MRIWNFITAVLAIVDSFAIDEVLTNEKALSLGGLEGAASKRIRRAKTPKSPKSSKTPKSPKTKTPKGKKEWFAITFSIFFSKFDFKVDLRVFLLFEQIQPVLENLP